MGFGKLHRLDATDPREIARQLDAKKRALERLLSYVGPQGDESAGKQALTDLVKEQTTLRLAAPMFELVPERSRVVHALKEVDAARRQLTVGTTPATAPEDRETTRRVATAKARRSVAELFVPRPTTDTDERGPSGDETRPVRDPTIELADFIAPERGSDSVSAIVIGNAEGTRTPGGGLKKAYGHHADPGNAKPNRGSYSLQNATHLSPGDADREQQRRMKAVQPAYVAACKAAGIDPRNVVALVSYWDLYNIKPALATKFASLMPDLARRGCTFEAALELRLRASKLLQGRSAWTGWENVARDRLKRSSPQITDDEFWRVVRMVHGERQSAMQASLAALRITKKDAAEQKLSSHASPAGPIRGSVGQGGANAPTDVEAVQNALVKHGHRVVVDRAIGPETIGAIRAFQASFMHAPDGRVDVGKQTAQRLFGAPTKETKNPNDPRGNRPTEPVLQTKGLTLGAGLTGVIGGKPKPSAPSTSAWNGTEGVADLAKRIAASMGIAGTGKRSHTVGGKSSTESDHHTSQRGAYAVDFGVLAKFGPRAKEVGTELATKIGQAYGIPAPYVGSYKKHYLMWNGIHVRIQLLWRVPGHYDHVHFGVRRVR